MAIDILLPYYGDPGYMRAAVRSVLGQSSPDWRLIVTDDCYPDESIGPWFANLEDHRIDYSRNAENLGANRNYTYALSKSRADWVVVMGADDLMLPTYVERVAEVIARFPDVDVVQSGVEVIDEHDAVVRTLVDRVKTRCRPHVDHPGTLAGEDLLISLMRGNWTYFPSLCWRRSMITAIGFRPEFHVVQDLGLLIDVIRAGGILLTDSEVTFHYRRHAGSDSAVKTVMGSRFAEERSYFTRIAAEFDASGMPRAARAARFHPTSRLHALALVPRAASVRECKAVRRLLRHGLMPVRKS